jgi:hypothetical protein
MMALFTLAASPRVLISGPLDLRLDGRIGLQISRPPSDGHGAR